MADKAAQHHSYNSAALQCLGCGVSKENRHEVENNIGSGVHDDVGAVGCIEARHLGKCCQKTLDQTCCRNSRYQRCEDLGDLLQNQVAQRLLLIRNLLVYGTACNGVSEDRYGCVINLCDLCAAYHLELSAGNDDRDNALQMLYHVFLCKALILQDKAQTGETVCHLFYIGFAAHIVKNVLGNFVVIHGFLSFVL